MEWMGAGAAIVMLGILGRMVFEAAGYRVRQEIVESGRIPASFDGCKILFITDIHRRKLSERKLRAVVPHADLVLVGGDLTEKGVPESRVRSNMEVLGRLGPVYAVLGNHDLKAGVRRVERILEQSGVFLLKDKSVALSRNGESLVISGLMQPLSRNHSYSSFSGRARKEQFHIVLVHDPIWIRGKKKLKADLILAGHTHGGQIILPFLGPVRLEGFYQTYGAGWFTLERNKEPTEQARLLISRGFGTSHIPLRFGCPSELHLITLNKTP